MKPLFDRTDIQIRMEYPEPPDTEAIDLDVGKIIRKIRIEKKLRQKDIAEAMTVQQSYISQIENGKTSPTPMFIKLFCLTFSVNEKQFYEDTTAGGR